jgi:hypothetical protein
MLLWYPHKATFSSQLLADIVKYLDMLGIYDFAIAHTFLLLDDHHSRVMPPFIM